MFTFFTQIFPNTGAYLNAQGWLENLRDQGWAGNLRDLRNLRGPEKTDHWLLTVDTD